MGYTIEKKADGTIEVSLEGFTFKIPSNSLPISNTSSVSIQNPYTGKNVVTGLNADNVDGITVSGETTVPTTVQQIYDLLSSVFINGGGNGTGVSVGFFDYNDLATSTTPISITGGAGFVYLTNDGLGAFTNKNYPPVGVTDVWDSANNEFDFSQLTLGSRVDIRTDLNITTASPNTEVELAIEMAVGGGSYDLVIDTESYKTASLHDNQTFYNWIYMGDLNTLNNPAKLKIKSSDDIDVVVNGKACHIIKY